MADILFISTMEGVPWGGSEELWSQSASLLAARGYAVEASVKHWPGHRRQVARIEACGVHVVERGKPAPERRFLARLFARVRRSLALPVQGDHGSIFRQIQSASPRLIVISNGAHLPPESIIADLLQFQIPYLNICQANREDFFIEDQYLQNVRKYAQSAVAMLFVSRRNAELFERQVGMWMANTRVVRNPYAVPFGGESGADQTWSPEIVNFAIVGRLHPPSKGHDIALAVLGRPEWKTRKWKLSLFGEGNFADVISEIAAMYGIADRVEFRGHVDNVGDIWKENEVLLLPSRYEGMPLAVVEAMLCGRVVVTNDVGGACELIDDNECGYLSRSPDIDSFSGALERAWSARANWASIGAKAASRVRELVGPKPVEDFVERLEWFLTEGIPQHSDTGSTNRAS